MAWRVASDIHTRLRDLRDALRWDQKDLARIVGRRVNAISEWENQKRKPPRSVLERLAEDLKLPLEIFTTSGPMPSAALERQKMGRASKPYTSTTGQDEIEALQRDPDYLPEGSGLDTQLPDDEVLHLILYNRRDFSAYLKRQVDAHIPVAAIVGYVNHVEKVAREKGVSVDPEVFEASRRNLQLGLL